MWRVLIRWPAGNYSVRLESAGICMSVVDR
jgi:hypothetical protein